MTNKITFTKQEKKFLKKYFSKEFLGICSDDLESAIAGIVKAYNNMEWDFSYHAATNDERDIYITYKFDYNCRKQADFVSVDINIDDYIYRNLVKNKRISNKYDLYEVTAKVCDFMQEEISYEK